MLVLLAAAGLFAVALHVALTARSGTVEARVLSERAAALREARSAAAILLTSLGTTPERFAGQSGSGSGDRPAAPDTPPASDEEEDIELPAIIKELIGKNIEDVEDQAKEDREQDNRKVQGSGISGRATAREARERIRFATLPTRPITVRLRDGGPSYRITIADAMSQLNINEASRDQMLAYFAAKGVAFETASAVTAQLMDWRDADSSPEPGGSEQDQYSLRNIACRNGPLTMLEELLFFPSMTPALYASIRPDLTTFGDARIHVGSASRAVLMSLPGVDEQVADAIIEARREAAITDEMLGRLLPIRAGEAKERLTTAPGSVLRLRVEPIGVESPPYEGLAVLNAKGVIRALGLRAIYE